MVLNHNLVITTFVIESEVVAKKRWGFNLCRLKSKEVDFLIVLDLDLFIIRHSLVLKELQGLAGRNWELDFVYPDCRWWLLWVRIIRWRVDLFGTILAWLLTIHRACVMAGLLGDLSLQLLSKWGQLLRYRLVVCLSQNEAHSYISNVIFESNCIGAMASMDNKSCAMYLLDWLFLLSW